MQPSPFRDDGNEKSCGNVTTCQITGLTNGKSYSFTVKAKNAVGWSEASQAMLAMPDKVPDPPREIIVEPGHLQATVYWSQPEYVGTPPDSYTVTLTGSNGWSKTQIADALQSTFTIENGSISDGTTFYATVQGRNRAGEGPVSAASRAEQVWGNPDAPTVNATQQGDDHISVDVTPGNLHNAGCSTIVISGGLMGTIDCTQKTITFNISSNQYWNQLTIKATLFAEKLSASSSSATTTITPSYSIPAASVVSLGLEGTDNVCTFRWNPKGHVDGFQVEGNGKSVTLGGQVRSWQYQIVPWTTCGTATIRQKLNSKVSTQSASLISNDTYQAQATVSLPTKVSWSRKGTDTVHIEKVGGHVDTYNISANKTFEIIFDDGTSDESDWIEGTTSFDISTQTEKVPTQWRIVVTATNPENQRLDTSSTGSVIETSALQTSSAIKPAENLSTSVFQSARQCGTLTNPCRSEVSAAAKTQTKESN